MEETQQMWVQSLGHEDLLEEEMAIHSSILAWKNPMDRGAWQATIHRVTNSQTQLKRLSSQAHTRASICHLHHTILHLHQPIFLVAHRD